MGTNLVYFITIFTSIAFIFAIIKNEEVLYVISALGLIILIVVAGFVGIGNENSEKALMKQELIKTCIDKGKTHEVILGKHMCILGDE